MPSFLISGINPEPWTAPSAGTRNGRGGGKYVQMYKDEHLASYQLAIKQAFESLDHELLTGPVDLHFAFWRELTAYRTAKGRVSHRKPADATNMQKALEDALQGVLFANDRQVVSIHSSVVKQGTDVSPMIAITVEPLTVYEISKANEALTQNVMTNNFQQYPSAKLDDGPAEDYSKAEGVF